MPESELRSHQIPVAEEHGDERPAEEQGGGEETGFEQGLPVGEWSERSDEIRSGEEKGGERAGQSEGQRKAAPPPSLAPDRGVVEERARESETQGRSAWDGPLTERTDRMKHDNRNRKAQKAQDHEGVHLEVATPHVLFRDEVQRRKTPQGRCQEKEKKDTH